MKRWRSDGETLAKPGTYTGLSPYVSVDGNLFCHVGALLKVSRGKSYHRKCCAMKLYGVCTCNGTFPRLPMHI
ncbi:hypothetical protein POVWA2_005410 [Plasmodium ovale wallikeri]|uniref:Uncharacterized protein n=1 Tax=Plasmodium ovale wallikeri TaxID=864142 RepID=A0A1A8YJG6_PLAOA|nr:hypothetical protein POVWA2_005410 [Plasmodium ovale wallikeri]